MLHADMMAFLDRNAILSRLSPAAAEVAGVPPGTGGMSGIPGKRWTMTKHAATLLFLLGIGAAPPAAAQDSGLIGYTAVTRNGAGGILVFNEDCDNAFPG